MKQFSAAIIVCLVSWATDHVYAEVLIKPDDPNINYYGRYNFSNSPNAVKFNWPGSIIETCFPGPSIGVEMNDGDTNYFNIEIDW